MDDRFDRIAEVMPIGKPLGFARLSIRLILKLGGLSCSVVLLESESIAAKLTQRIPVI
jgi:hypothetical protein